MAILGRAFHKSRPLLMIKLGIGEQTYKRELPNWQVHEGLRLPFLVGILVAATGYVVRNSLQVEEPVATSKSPVRDVFRKHHWSIIKVALLNVGNGVGFYAAFVYAVTYIQDQNRSSPQRVGAIGRAVQYRSVPPHGQSQCHSSPWIPGGQYGAGSGGRVGDGA